MPNKKIEDLNKMYLDAEASDTELFAEQRSNLLLISGDHYFKKGSRFWNRIRDSKELSNEQKLRLTKNHIQKITKQYVNNIMSHAPGVAALPHNESELQDQKAAEMHDSVIKDAKARFQMDRKHREWCEDFVNIGEVAVKIYWDPNAGPLKSYNQQIGEDGQPIMDEQGQPVAGEPNFTGEMKFERIFGFNLMRSPEAQSMDESPYLIIRKTAAKETLKKQFPDEDPRRKYIEDSSEEPFLVFDGVNGTYSKSDKTQVLLREYYFRPGPEYPHGYYYITTSSGILWEGELPFGIFPIVTAGFDDIQTSPRARSIIKVIRPYQAEINRAASKVAEHQITLGDDKLLIQSGTKLTHGGVLPGVRGISYTGAEPGVLQGRSGEQYVSYIESQIKEMYLVCNLDIDGEEIGGQLDAYTLLYRSIRNKKKFSLYGVKFEQFLIQVYKTFLALAKQYYTEDMVVMAAGRSERVNIAEFKAADDICYQIKIDSRIDDPETMMGKQLFTSQVLQYVGSNLPPDVIGKVIKMAPFANNDQMFEDLTMDADTATNIILSLDRGEPVAVNKYDTHQYIIKRLTTRMRKADFKFLPPQVQMLYQQHLAEREQVEAELQQQIAMMKESFIPAGGYMVTCDLYVTDPANPNKTRRARIPYQSLEWLIKKLETQGSSLASLETQQEGVAADMAAKLGGSANNLQMGGQGSLPIEGPSAPDSAMGGIPNGSAGTAGFSP